VAARAQVTLKTIHKHDRAMAIIDTYRHRPTPRPPATARETSILGHHGIVNDVELLDRHRTFRRPCPD
jgi:hypothetical protein